MTARLTRTAHGLTLQSSGIEIGDDGRAAAWSTSGHRVGRFARTLSAGERAAFERALTAARDAGEPPAPGPAGQAVHPGGATEQLIADGLPAIVLDAHQEPPPGSEDLVRLMRTLREDLAASPVAAIELDVSGSPLGAWLRHVGSEPVAVRIATLTVQATLFGPDSALLDSATHTVDASGAGSQAGPGWSLPLAEDLGLAAPSEGGFLTVTVGTPEVDALGNGVLHPAELAWMTE
jgi:hypothetical protein